uniref:Uncharacterized protein n=1 Tax=Arion vulgaris TaxID=1028688 RepID=A0A0B7A691_9EUPU
MIMVLLYPVPQLDESKETVTGATITHYTASVQTANLDPRDFSQAQLPVP